MGARHFKQMYADALVLDRKALAKAAMMSLGTPRETRSLTGAPWQGQPPDRILDFARKLLDLDTWFTNRLKLMLLDGDITVLLSDREGVPHKVREPEVFDFDDPVVPEKIFYDVVKEFLSGKFVQEIKISGKDAPSTG